MKKRVNDIRMWSGVNVKEMVDLLGTTGFQASCITEAVEIIKDMREKEATVFLSFTANMMASGLRGILTQLVEKGIVNAVVTTGGSIDHDIIKSFKNYILGKYRCDDKELHRRGINRIGNILIPNDRYLLLEKKMERIFSAMYKKIRVFSPSELNEYIGSILPEGSFLRECYKRKVPVFCPGLIDSAVGMHLYFFRQKHGDFVMDVAKDLKILADMVFDAKKTGGIILGGGIAKHHVIGANLLRGGLDYAVYVTTAKEYDGSLSGAPPSEAKSWGKIKSVGRTVVVYGDVTIVLPLIVGAII